MVKLVGRPKVKRNRQPDEASNRKGIWSVSRKGSIMSCSKCGEPNHNSRACYKDNRSGQTSQPWKERSCSQNTSQNAVTEDDEIQAATQQSTGYGPSVGDEEDPPLRPSVVSERNNT